MANLEEKIGLMQCIYTTIRKGIVAVGVGYFLIAFPGCGGTEEEKPECSTSSDCFNNCLKYAGETACNFSHPSPGEVDRCKQRETQRCYDDASSQRLQCGRRCGERTIETERGTRTEAYCENACGAN